MNYYFEFDEQIVGNRYLTHRDQVVPHRFCAIYGQQGTDPTFPIKASYLASRIWRENDNGHVEYIKNRYNTLADVDLKEFVWVKLSAREL